MGKKRQRIEIIKAIVRIERILKQNINCKEKKRLEDGRDQRKQEQTFKVELDIKEEAANGDRQRKCKNKRKFKRKQKIEVKIDEWA